ncbi:TPR domain containing protein [Zea mays]|uniref:TPR domain containing protein n=3 Tax=Zea mays TaxID=4577 RepID=B6TAE3_MAIZE|nr:TPR domain containing protein [Zea mays]ACG34076.1 TPR domain containing protein [Zea mays]ACG37697.1 TPR domain containing protein [Zea mays]ACG40160.1 TPR domain containing protein [Zea mays]ACN34263.1 unknown [Zea mays]ONM28088.1 Tetratricopeptide repeat (TPR)-like superfamily protein [Zea mays]|eukprot:NP_001266549.2 TPR domain containing protein [Zea mays]
MASSSENAAVPPEEEPQAPPPPDTEPTEAAPGEAEDEPQTLERAQELFDRGSKAIEDEDFVDAVDCLSRALEIRASHYGELAPECASTYFKYGCALLYKAQEESDVLGNVPKSLPNEDSVKSTATKDDSGTSKVSGTDAEDAASSEKVDAEEGHNSNGKNQENGNGEVEKDDDDVDDDEKMGDEEDNDLDLSWKMLDIARAIVEKSQDNTMEKVKIYSALAEVATEREDMDNSLSDYMKALSMLEHLVEPDHRRVVELNFRICLVYELVSKIGEAISYCAKAISLCKSRIQSLKSSKDALLAGIDGDASAAEAEGGSEKSAIEKELEQLTSILPDLEKKLEDLSEANPSADMDEMVKAIVSRVTDVMPKAASFTSSQMATSSNGFDSSVMSTAATTGSSGSTVTDLGVVGRGVKRASIKPISAEPAAKKPALDSPSQQGDSSINSEVVPATQTGDESVSK